MTTMTKPFIPSAEAKHFFITSLAGVPNGQGKASLRQFPRGDQMLLLEVTCPAGHHSPLHDHDHESVGYMVSGELETEIDGVKYLVKPGDVFFHPAHVKHRQRVIKDSVW